MCSRLKWKPASGPDADCDGTTLGSSSVCCPLYGNVPCNGDTRYKCMENPSMQGLLKIWSTIPTSEAPIDLMFLNKTITSQIIIAVISQLQDTARDDEFYHLDLSNKCIQKLAPFPTVTEGRKVGVFKGRPIACGGRTGGYGSSMPSACYEYKPGTGAWTSIGNLVRHGLFGLHLCSK